jgi:hypothetical protein
LNSFKGKEIVAKVLILLLVVVSYGVPAASSAEDLCAGARKLLKDVASIRGLPVGSGFACRVENRSQVETFIRASAAERLPHSRLQYEEELLRLLGVIPRDYPYFEGMVALYTSQLGGYYDPKTKTIVMADWMPEELQRTIAIHELTHLLQDQTFNLQKLVGTEIVETDQALAHAAIVEGDASVLTFDAEFKKKGAGRVADLQKLPPLNVVSQEEKVLEGKQPYVPDALMALILFPYEEGGNFSHSLLKRGGYKAIDKALKTPPETTREVLHPEVYHERVSGRVAIDSQLPEPPSDIVYQDTLGEFFVGAALSSTIKSVKTRKEVASFLLKDRAYLVESKGGQRTGVWVTVWSNNESAQIFANYLRIHLRESRGVQSDDIDNTVIAQGTVVTARLKLK